MKKENIIGKLHIINKELSHRSLKNPASLSSINTISVTVDTKEEEDEVISLIGKWSYKKQTAERKKLEEEKKKLEAALKKEL